MTKRILPTQDQALRERLRREAREDWPAYNETLHRRIIAAVRQRRAEKSPRRAPAVVRWRGRLTAAFAAACLLCAVALGWRMTQRDKETEFVFAQSDATLASLPLPGELAGRGMDTFNRVIISAALPPQSADLAHDTRLAAETVLERLPVGVELLAGP